MARKLIAELFTQVANAPTVETKVALLQQNNNLAVRQLLLAALDPTIKFDVEIPEYKENFETDGYSANNLYVEYRRIYLFMDSFQKVTPKRKSALLAQILESIDKSDAVLLLKIIRKDLSEYGLTKELVNQAFPGLIK